MKTQSKKSVFIFVTVMMGVLLDIGEGQATEDDVQIIRQNGSLFLQSSCTRARRYIDKIKVWAKSAGTKTQDAVLIKDETMPRGQCRYQIDSALPSFARQSVHNPSVRYGPNCFNTALVAAQIMPGASYTAPMDVDFWVNSPLCRPIPQGTAPIPGDLGIVRTFQGGVNTYMNAHGFVNIGEGLIYEKNSPDAADTPEIDRIDNLANHYFTDSDPENPSATPGYSQQLFSRCQNLPVPDPTCPYSNYSKIDDSDDREHHAQQMSQASERIMTQATEQCREHLLNMLECKTFINYYRCQSVDTYISKSGNPPPQFQAYRHDLNKLQCQISGAMTSSNPLSPTQIDLIETSLQLIDHYADTKADQAQLLLEQARATNNQSDVNRYQREKFLWEMVAAGATGAISTLDLYRPQVL